MITLVHVVLTIMTQCICPGYTSSMSTMPFGEVQDHLSEIMDEVATTHERVTITKPGRPAVMLIAVADFEAMEETLDILSTPGALDEIRQAEWDFAAGDVISAEEALAEHRARLT